jgi:hypothetical protein
MMTKPTTMFEVFCPEDCSGRYDVKTNSLTLAMTKARDLSQQLKDRFIVLCPSGREIVFWEGKLK